MLKNHPINDFGLLKLPAEAAVKQLRIENGQLKARIDELEDLKLRYREKVLECYERINELKLGPKPTKEEAQQMSKDLRREEIIKELQEQLNMVNKRLHHIKKEHDILIMRALKLERILKKNNINPDDYD